MNNSPNFLESCEMLGLNPDELMLSPTLSDNTPDSVRNRIRQLNAVTKLSICMTGWNKVDGFDPDEKADWESDNVGFTPHFCLKKGKLLSSGLAFNGSTAGMIAAYANLSDASTLAYFGLRLCLSTQQRAVEFGEVFIETFNELV